MMGGRQVFCWTKERMSGKCEGRLRETVEFQIPRVVEETHHLQSAGRSKPSRWSASVCRNIGGKRLRAMDLPRPGPALTKAAYPPEPDNETSRSSFTSDVLTKTSVFALLRRSGISFSSDPSAPSAARHLSSTLPTRSHRCSINFHTDRSRFHACRSTLTLHIDTIIRIVAIDTLNAFSSRGPI